MLNLAGELCFSDYGGKVSSRIFFVGDFLVTNGFACSAVNRASIHVGGEGRDYVG